MIRAKADRNPPERRPPNDRFTSDRISRPEEWLLEKILKEEEEHIDWLEVRCGQIEEMGLPNYLAHQIED